MAEGVFKLSEVEHRYGPWGSLLGFVMLVDLKAAAVVLIVI